MTWKQEKRSSRCCCFLVFCIVLRMLLTDVKWYFDALGSFGMAVPHAFYPVIQVQRLGGRRAVIYKTNNKQQSAIEHPHSLTSNNNNTHTGHNRLYTD